VLEGDVFRRGFDLAGEGFDVFERRALGTDEAENDSLARGDEAQRFEGAGALVVVLEKEAIDVEGGEEFFGDGVVATLGVPVAAIVAAAEMDAEGDAGDAGGLETLVVGGEGFVEGGLGVEAHLVLHPVAPFGVEVVAVAGSVDLDVVDVAGGELLHLVANDCGDVVEEIRVVGVDAIGDTFFEGDGGELGRAGQGHLDGAGRVFLEEVELVEGERAEFFDTRLDDSGHTAGGHAALAVPGAIDGVVEVEAANGIGEVAHEVAAAKFTIGEDIEAEFLLAAEDAEDVCVFDLGELLRGCGVASGLKQFLGTKEAANVVGAPGVGHVCLLGKCTLEGCMPTRRDARAYGKGAVVVTIDVCGLLIQG
jgi:hypothetical protein